MIRTKAAKNFEERREAKKERYEELAEKNRKLSNATYDNARKMASIIPFGQPILVGHHSEKADRRYRARIENTFNKSFELDKKADYYENKAKSQTNAILSDDPEAIIKLREKIEKLETKRDKLKLVNKCLNSVIRKYKTIEKSGYFEKWKEYDHEKIAENFEELKIKLTEKCKKENCKLSESEINLLLTKPEYGRFYGIPTYQITSLTTKIREEKKRIEYMIREEKREEINFVINDVEVKEEEGRINVYFVGKPNEETRKAIKSWPLSMKWSRYNCCWTRKKTASVGQSFITALKNLLNSENLY